MTNTSVPFEVTWFSMLGNRSAEIAFEQVRGLLIRLDPLIGPLSLRMGEDEADGPPVNAISAERYTSCPAGYMAIGNGSTIEVSKDRPPRSGTADGVRVHVALENVHDAHIVQLLEELTLWAPQHGVICAWGGAHPEIRSHLFAKLQLPNGSVESYVGRNHRRFVPGLFWWNFWSRTWLRERRVSLDTLPNGWSISEQVNMSHVVVQGRHPWQLWEQHLFEAKAWAARQVGVFSMHDLNNALPDTMNELKAVRFLRQWK